MKSTVLRTVLHVCVIASFASGCKAERSAPVVGTTGPSGTSGTQGANGATGLDGAFAAIGATGYTGVTGAMGMTGAGQSGVTGASGNSGATGATGASGASGMSGSSGATGRTGASGASGASGSSGATGRTGASGASGASGTSGATGATGAGESGVTGSTGATGSTGEFGSTGESGATGISGNVGSVGSTGESGATGASGSSGSSGASGSSGSSGATGESGATGSSGATGASGASGSSGASGASGSSGSSGATGATGATGTPGPGGMLWRPISMVATTLTAVAGGALGVNGTAAVSTPTQSDALYVQWTTANTLNSIGALVQTINQTRGSWHPVLRTRIKTDSAIDSRRIWVALASASLALSEADTGGFPTPYVGVRYSTGAGDTNWQCGSGDGVNASVVDTGVVVTADTAYEITVDWSDSGTLRCTINGVTTDKTTDLEAAGTTALRIHNMVTNLLAGTGRIHRISYIYLQMDGLAPQ